MVSKVVKKYTHSLEQGKKERMYCDVDISSSKFYSKMEI